MLKMVDTVDRAFLNLKECEERRKEAAEGPHFFSLLSLSLSSHSRSGSRRSLESLSKRILIPKEAKFTLTRPGLKFIRSGAVEQWIISSSEQGEKKEEKEKEKDKGDKKVKVKKGPILHLFLFSEAIVICTPKRGEVLTPPPPIFLSSFLPFPLFRLFAYLSLPLQPISIRLRFIGRVYLPHEI